MWWGVCHAHVRKTKTPASRVENDEYDDANMSEGRSTGLNITRLSNLFRTAQTEDSAALHRVLSLNNPRLTPRSKAIKAFELTASLSRISEEWTRWNAAFRRRRKKWRRVGTGSQLIGGA